MFIRLKDGTRGMRRTEIIYWRNSYMKVFRARVLRAKPEKRRPYLVFDRRAFHANSGNNQ